MAFVYDGWDGAWREIGKRLYDSEPVVRSVLDHCEALFREETDASLLDPLFDGEGTAHPFDDPAWTDPAAYALQCAITALWSSLDVQPSAVCGRNAGEIAAAQAAGAFTLDEGLRIALARGEILGAMDEARNARTATEPSKTRLEGITVSTPSLTIVSGATGKQGGAGGDDGPGPLDSPDGRRRRRGIASQGSGASARSLADLAVDTLIRDRTGIELCGGYIRSMAGEAGG